MTYLFSICLIYNFIDQKRSFNKTLPREFEVRYFNRVIYSKRDETSSDYTLIDFYRNGFVLKTSGEIIKLSLFSVKLS